MTNAIRISDAEFYNRAKNVQKLMCEQGVDVLLCFGNEAEPQFVRYLSDYWPSFETAGVLLGQSGAPLLLIGPESLTFARDRSRITDIRRIQSFRESSNPEYPGTHLDTFKDAIGDVLQGRPLKKAAIAGYNLIPKIVWDDYEKALKSFGKAPIVWGDDIVMALRMIKSADEIACMRHAGSISAKAMDYVIENMRPGMTELQVRGLACAKIYELGGENEAYPMWTLAGLGGNQAISRARQKAIGKNELIHIGVGARYEGYASSIGRQVVFGKPESWMVDAIRAGYAAHEVVASLLYDGNNAGNVADGYYAEMKRNGFFDWLLYGPCHATGLMEGEPPWIEANSDYPLRENMTYCIDIFMGNKEGYGLRVEDSVRVGRTGADSLTNYRKELFVL
jgi:Xaa-Pro aminopeptidase